MWPPSCWSSIPEIGQAYRAWFQGFEAFSIAVFTVEYVLRVWSAIEQTYPRYKHPLWGRLRYAASPMAVIDLLAVLPFYLSFLLPIDLRVLRVLRLVRMFKLTRYSPAMNLLLAALREEVQAIAAALFVLLLLLVLASSLAYLAEHEAQPAAFGTIPQAMWWAIVTLTTVGYGDVVPVTPLGKRWRARSASSASAWSPCRPACSHPASRSSCTSAAASSRRRSIASWRAARSVPDEGDELRAFRDRLGLSDHQAAEIVRLRRAPAPRRASARTAASRWDRRPPRATPLQGDRRPIHSPRNSDPMTPDRANIRES